METENVANTLAVIIEDDEKLSVIFTEAVKQAGFQTKAVRDGQDAFFTLLAQPPRLVVLDLHLPHVSGLEILKNIRSDDRFARTWVVVATADPSMADALEDEGDFVLIKPVSFSQMRDLAIRLKSTE